ncbi:Trm112 family protein [Arthrobacter sp. NPDC090010]|uniref:Trm112 family protein n=1 Tax=Arthrobacter sp. NPDC090010 TaxID=3363942 RepID=UPI00380BCAAF
MSVLSPELLSILRSPENGEPLRLEGGELVAGTGSDAPRYPVEGGIPLLLPASLREASRSAD